MNKKRLIAGAFALIALAGVFVVAKGRGWLTFSGTVKEINVDLARPDGYIRTKSLAQLPRDLLKVPMARDVLSEDLLYYYEQHEDKLSLRGSLRRIAYEHDLKWEDRLLDMMLDEPAEVALWRDSRGSLRYFLLAMTRNQLAKIIQQAVLAGASDTQLSLLAEIKVDGDKVPLLALRHSSNQTLVFAARGNRIVVLSDPAMVVNSEKSVHSEASKILQQLLAADESKQALYTRYFAINQAERKPSKHNMVLGTDFLSFGYQHFFPGMEALRFDFSEQGAWQSQVLFDGKQLAKGSLRDSAIWSSLPMDASACALLPVDWQLGNNILDPLAADKVKALLAQFDGPAAICWYAQSTFHTPLVVAHLKPGAKPDTAFLEQLFQWAIKGAQQSVAKTGKDGAHIWQHAVAAPFAWQAPATGKVKVTVKKKGAAASEAEISAYQVSLAQHGDYILFSPDAKLVELGLASVAKRYPKMHDVLPKAGTTLGLFVPNKLARMVQNESMEVLATPGEEIFLAAAKEHLWPKLEILKKYPAYRLSLDETPSKAEPAWHKVQWQAVEGRK
mgnify:CR=1 FL=1